MQQSIYTCIYAKVRDANAGLKSTLQDHKEKAMQKVNQTFVVVTNQVYRLPCILEQVHAVVTNQVSVAMRTPPEAVAEHNPERKEVAEEAAEEATHICILAKIALSLSCMTLWIAQSLSLAYTACFTSHARRSGANAKAWERVPKLQRPANEQARKPCEGSDCVKNRTSWSLCTACAANAKACKSASSKCASLVRVILSALDCVKHRVSGSMLQISSGYR